MTAAIQQATLRQIVTLLDDAGQEGCDAIDTGTDPFGPITIQGYKIASRSTVVLPVGAVDKFLGFVDATMLVLYGSGRFSLRLAAGETLLTNLRLFAVAGQENDEGVISSSVLITAVETSEVTLRVVVVEAV